MPNPINFYNSISPLSTFQIITYLRQKTNIITSFIHRESHFLSFLPILIISLVIREHSCLCQRCLIQKQSTLIYKNTLIQQITLSPVLQFLQFLNYNITERLKSNRYDNIISGNPLRLI